MGQQARERGADREKAKKGRRLSQGNRAGADGETIKGGESNKGGRGRLGCVRGAISCWDSVLKFVLGKKKDGGKGEKGERKAIRGNEAFCQTGNLNGRGPTKREGLRWGKGLSLWGRGERPGAFASYRKRLRARLGAFRTKKGMDWGYATG